MQSMAWWHRSYFCSGKHECEFEALAKLVQVVTVKMDTILGPVADRQWDFCPVVNMFHVKTHQTEQKTRLATAPCFGNLVKQCHISQENFGCPSNISILRYHQVHNKFHSMLGSDGFPKVNDVNHKTKYFTVICSVNSSDVIAARIHNNYSLLSLSDYWISFGQIIYLVDAVGSSMNCRNAPVKLSIDSHYLGDGWLTQGDTSSRAWPGIVGRRNNVVTIAPYEWVAHQNHAGEIWICGSHWGCQLYWQCQFVKIVFSTDSPVWRALTCRKWSGCVGLTFDPQGHPDNPIIWIVDHNSPSARIASFNEFHLLVIWIRQIDVNYC